MNGGEARPIRPIGTSVSSTALASPIWFSQICFRLLLFKFVSKRLRQLEGGRILTYNHTGQFPQLLSTRFSWVFWEVIFSDDPNHLLSVFPHYVLLFTQLIYDF